MPFFVELDSKPSMSASYQLWQRIYNVSTRHKPYIAEYLLKDSTQNPTPSNFIPPITSTTKITLTGHSLGGALAQLFALSFATEKSASIIKSLYTYNAPGARTITSPYDYVIKTYTFHSEAQKERFIKEETQNIAKRARELGRDHIFLESKIQKCYNDY